MILTNLNKKCTIYSTGERRPGLTARAEGMAGHHIQRSPLRKENKMKLSNIINFVKAGYTPAEIAGMENADAVSQLLQEGIKKEEIPDYLALLKDDPSPDPEPEKDKIKPSQDEPENDPTDYKEKYQTLLKKTQEEAARKNMKPEEKSSDEVLAEIVKQFM